MRAYAVILAGGSGERFWPLSTQERPKQFVSIFGGKPLICHAVDRLEGLFPPERIIIITAASLVEASADACPNVPKENIIGEPMRRDTAAASALACGIVKARDEDGIAVILTADQLMADEAEFRATIAAAIEYAGSNEAIVTIGIKPDHPATGFGYIDSGEALPSIGNIKMRKVNRFVEKPDLDTARKYLESGTFFWNSGMFIWSVKTMAKAIERFVPELSGLVDLPSRRRGDFVAALEEIYPTVKKVSVDYAIMEKYPDIAVVPGNFGWDDVGAWPSVAKHFEADSDNNVSLGNTALLNCHDSIVISGDGHITAAIGLDDFVVVHTEKATLVCPKSRAQEIKQLLKLVSFDS